MGGIQLLRAMFSLIKEFAHPIDTQVPKPSSIPCFSRRSHEASVRFVGETYSFFKPKPDGHCAWFFIVNDQQWEGMPFEWRSPLYQKVFVSVFPSLRDGLAARTVRAMCRGDPAPILDVAARHAFYDLHEAGIKKLAVHLKLDVPSKASTYDTVAALVKKVLKLDDGPELFDIMKYRVERVIPNVDLLMEVDEAVAVLDRDDQEELRKKQEDNKKTLSRQKQIVVDYTKACVSTV